LKSILQELQKPNSQAVGIFSLILSFDAKWNKIGFSKSFARHSYGMR
jgi:hypothetical protein